MIEPTIVVHGGAWSIPQFLAAASIDGVKLAASEGYKLLSDGASAVDAVVAAIVSLEDNPVFDAGTGSVLNALGEIEMDAVIMNGKTKDYGSIAALANIKNPIKLARLLLVEHKNTFLIGSSANEFADEKNVERATLDELLTPLAKMEWQKAIKYNQVIESRFKSRVTATQPSGHDTVGAVALDCHGNMAFGTSTGGIMAKHPGRVGDSPIVGCGGMSDDKIGSVSTTGHGESITKVCLAKDILLLINQGLSAQEAVSKSLGVMTDRVNGSGGAIVLSKTGQIGIDFTTDRMAWSYKRKNEFKFGLDPGDGYGFLQDKQKMSVPRVLDSKSNPRIPILIVHSVFGSQEQGQRFASLNQSVASKGHKMLTSKGSVVDAVVSAIMEMEKQLGITCNASVVMNGQDLSVGSASGVANVRHHIELSKHIMMETPHTMVVGKGVSLLAEKAGLLHETEKVSELKESRTGCLGIGAVAMDCHGNLACAQVSPYQQGWTASASLIGSHAYADNMSGAVSLLGSNENISKESLAKHLLFHHQGDDGSDMIRQLLEECQSNDDIGVIMIDTAGHPFVHVSMSTTCSSMYYDVITNRD